MQAKKKEKARRIGSICFFATFFLLLMVGIICLLNGTETHSSSTDGNSKLNSLFCSASKITNAFFASNGEKDVKHEVKFTFNNNAIDKASYVYTANFETEKEATVAANDFHVKYNNYMGETNVYQEDLTPTFTQKDKTIMINLFISRNNFNIDTAKLLLLNESEFSNGGEYTSDDLMKLYSAKGFSCVRHG